ncbi:FAD-dependent oxidoreductase [Amycolatopsis sp. OK19-0408]|uniref:FAD-dependent oxidoreductase n=1 Tax=Amycolatopsis iheyensis TaxID=2945988 RepID=A0A9X2SKA0_9PSEU|nr:FAD-dependent oxidoreductase [Amycolatopsis iheyensis]MCR6483160.1 FAD-dependent oxidoreductase [Amycolatopsis iheyensis]
MTLVVVGASLAGLRAVEAARRTGYRGRIVLVGAEARLPYDRPPLSKAFLDPGGPGEVPPFHAETVLRDELGVELMLGAPAEHLDTDVREVTVAGAAMRYDALVIATGATARRLPGARTLRTAEDAVAVRAALDAGARTVVVGAGFIGSEVASAARKRGLPVTIVEASATPLHRAVGAAAGAELTALHHAAGTELRLGAEVTGVSAEGVALAGGEVLPADLVVAGIGAVPATGWLEGSGLTLHERDGGIVCDETLSAGPPGVYAAGDVAYVPNPLFDGMSMRLEHWTNAAEQGGAAARHALDPASARPLGAVPYFWSDWYGHRIQFVGTPEADEVVRTGGATLYRRGDRVVGALTIDRPREIMKHRRRIAARAPWSEALAVAGAA